ncbi:MAG: hypothetical protein Q9162_000512 [Coniocarpon cinnabarinum]
MTSEPVLLSEEAVSVPLPKSPIVRINSRPLPTDSMVSIALSEPPSEYPLENDSDTSSVESDATIEPVDVSSARRSSAQIFQGVDLETEINGPRENVDEETAVHTSNDADISEVEAAAAALEGRPRSRRATNNSNSSQESLEDESPVDWAELEKNEESEPRDKASDEQMSFLLARLEQENQALAKNPRVIGLKRAESKRQRPPSIQVLKKLVNDPQSPSTRMSMRFSLPNPPPMTELEFWAALVKDYPQTASRLPTLTANKIKGGVPPPLRGVVWMSMVGARDDELSEKFDKLSTESSPYETMIGKDIGRSFPAVEMFKEAGGEGQTMLAMVLKVFSLYDTDIGYCQGLGFLVGPLLMQMGEKEAFCVLVKLMEKYDLRSCFMPDLAGLHLRIYQFQKLLTQHMPKLAEHLANMQIEAAYLSQWFLSFFAVTCPLDMLFRIYDVILAEGAPETIMRVAMSLMKRNEAKLMAHNEFEETMQLLLGRQLWAAYNFDADDLVNDFLGMTGIVTRDTLNNLEAEFRTAKEGGSTDAAVNVGFFSDVSGAASRFLGRLWVSHGTNKSTASLAPVLPNGSEKKRFLRRTASKQSVSISINSSDGSSDGSTNQDSSASTTTEATSVADASVMGVSHAHSKTESSINQPMSTASKEDRDLHGQIEDLLTALSEMQRDQAITTAQLQKEREERDEDHKLMQEIVNRIKTEDGDPTPPASRGHERRMTAPNLIAAPMLSSSIRNLSHELSGVVDRIDQRLATHRDLRRTSMLETRERLRKSLSRSKNMLSMETTRSQELSQRLDDQERESGALRTQLAEARAHVDSGHKEKQRLEQIIADMRAYQRSSVASTASTASSTATSSETEEQSPAPTPAIRRTDSTSSSKRFSMSSFGSNSSNSSFKARRSSGLRELRLGKPDATINPQPQNTHKHTRSNLSTASNASAIPARGSSLATREIIATKNQAPASEDQMLVELVAAKTAEAVARQELEEIKGRMEAMRKMLSAPQMPGPISIPDPIAALSNSNKSTPESQTGSGVKDTSAETPLAKKGRQDSSGALLTPPSSTAESAKGGWFPWRRAVSTSNAVIPEDGSKK